jgi:hypothetical protein
LTGNISFAPSAIRFAQKNTAPISVDAGQGEREMLRDMVSPDLPASRTVARLAGIQVLKKQTKF